jgi:hypothetical protein
MGSRYVRRFTQNDRISFSCVSPDRNDLTAEGAEGAEGENREMNNSDAAGFDIRYPFYDLAVETASIQTKSACAD